MSDSTQIEPSSSWRINNLPRDPITGKPLGGPGRPKGTNAQLLKHDLRKVFNLLGGVKGMYEWAMRSEKNKRDFYVQILPKMLGAETVDAMAEKMSHRPRITKIENVIIDPKENYNSTMIDGEATLVERNDEVRVAKETIEEIHGEQVFEEVQEVLDLVSSSEIPL